MMVLHCWQSPVVAFLARRMRLAASKPNWVAFGRPDATGPWAKDDGYVGNDGYAKSAEFTLYEVGDAVLLTVVELSLTEVAVGPYHPVGQFFQIYPYG